jgi:hypothetical protein
MNKHILMASIAVLALGLASAASADPITKKPALEFKPFNHEVNHSQITQIDTGRAGNEATVEQSATYTGQENQNQSDIYQHGSNNEADVKQIGQGSTPDGTTNISAIDQGGANLSVIITQRKSSREARITKTPRLLASRVMVTMR